MKKICIFCGNISRTGGTERAVCLLTEMLSQYGFSVIVLSASNGLYSGYPINPLAKLYSLGMENHSANLSDIRLIFRLRRFITSQQFDFIIDVDTILSLYSIAASLFLQTKVISWEHFNANVNVGDFVQKARRFIARKLALLFSYRLVTLTENDREVFSNSLFGTSRVVCIPNPVSFTHSMKCSYSEKTVLAVGRLVKQKGFDLLLLSWAKLFSAHQDWALKIVGSGPLLGDLTALSESLGIATSVQFVPFSQDISYHYANSSIFALSSRFEGFGLVLVEAKSFGLPIVAFNCDFGPSEIVSKSVDGFLIEPGDVDAFSKALGLLINDGDLWTSFSHRALQDDRFSMAKIGGLWNDVLTLE